MKKNLFTALIMTLTLFMTACGTSTTVNTTENIEDIVIEVNNESSENIEKKESNEQKVESEFESTSEEASEAEIVESTETSEAENTEATEVEEVVENKEPIINEVSYDKYATCSLNVRDYPDVSGNKLGALALNNKVHVTGECDNDWVRIDYKGNVAYVKATYLSDTEVKIPEPTNPPKQEENNNSSESTGNVVVVGKEGTFDLAAGQKALELTNAKRTEAGLNTLVWDDSLYETAKIRAAEASISWSHTRPDGSKWVTVGSNVHGENLAKGYSTAEEAVNAWMNSQGHKDNILREPFTRGAVAFFSTDNGWFWCEHFGY